MVFEPILEEGVFRFDFSETDRAAAFPSLSFADPNVREAPIAVRRVPEYVPAFERRRGQQMVTIQFPSGTSFYGTGEVSGQLERTGNRERFSDPKSMGLSGQPLSGPDIGGFAGDATPKLFGRL
ncbi:hypothetical protein C4D60_Mb11t05820 [Musa balbisiana]|uniref:Uncharacterized protein n=1 Tax=Musa balbisiana TaxID=52838 RepID=A0A4S8J204_MUSBA|nr:hypothetical protein C4D60_Mb11t05820 [Musa balbisiana]